MTLIAIASPRRAFSISLRAWRGITVAAVLALLVACSGGAPTSSPSPTPTPALPPTPTLAPTATPRIGLLIEPESFEGYTLFADPDGRRAYLINHQGYVAYTWPSGSHLARLLDNGNVLSFSNKESDPDGNIVWRFSFPSHHDLLKLPNGNVLILSVESILTEEAIALGANLDPLSCGPQVRGTRIAEARPTGPRSAEIVWDWSVFDHLIQDFDPEKPNYGVVADHPERIDLNYALADALCEREASVRPYLDWTHANALDYNAELDQIMVTVRHFSEIWVIDHSVSAEEADGSAGGNAGRGGDLLYRWGNPRAHRAGTPADQRLFWPHAAHWIPEGSPGADNVLIFNNGSEYPGFERGYSSVDEIALPTDGYNYRLDAGLAYGPDEIAWTYAADPPESFYAAQLSNAQRLPNGNTLITDGLLARIFEVTREGKTVWDFMDALLIVPTRLYRAYRYPPDHPGLRGLDLTPWRTAYQAAVQGEPLARLAFDIYTADGALVYVKERCEQSDIADGFFLHIYPERTDDLPATRRANGYDKLDFYFFRWGALFDGKCAASVPLPDYPVSRIRTGQPPGERPLWSAQLWLNPEPYRTTYRAAVRGEPLVRSTFDLYAVGGALIYVKEQCGQGDIAHRFFLHIVPERTDDLPEGRREHGFDNLDFDFFGRGALFDGKCAARVPLPDYAVASIRTGQFIRGEGELWSAASR